MFKNMMKVILLLLIVFGKANGENSWAPDFIIIGAQKSGTGILSRILMQHPEIAWSNHSEGSFFDLNFHKGTQWYKNRFPSCSTDCITGEKTPYYLFHPLVPERIFTVYPKVRIIVILRNPVDRAYSHYWFNRYLGKENALSFEEALELENERTAGEEELIKSNPLYDSRNFRLFAYIKRGQYAEQISRWLSLFPKNQICIIITENLLKKPKETLQNITSFLNLPFYEDFRFEFKKSNYPPMNPETRSRLLDFFRPYNRQLEELLDSPFDWDH
mgnify:CR=1 FL=1